MKSLDLPVESPALVGQQLVDRFPNADAFRHAVGSELRRQTDRERRAPFCPTNLRMYRQTYWGLVALGSVSDPILPWAAPGPRAVIEVLPALMARRLCPKVPYKLQPNGLDGRIQLVAKLEESLSLEIEDMYRMRLLADVEGDAVDAVLSAVEAGGALAAKFGVRRQFTKHPAKAGFTRWTRDYTPAGEPGNIVI